MHNYQCYGPMFLAVPWKIIVEGTPSRPHHDVGNHLGPCSLSQDSKLRGALFRIPNSACGSAMKWSINMTLI